MANEITSSTTSLDQEKFLAAKLLQRAHLKLVAASIADKVQQPRGTGTTAYFVRYKRMKVPLTPLSEGVKPSNSTISLEQVTGTLDQWGDVVTITDVARLTTKHPLVQIATDLLADNAQRVIDREIQIVMMAGTNVQYGDGTVSARSGITTAMTVSDTILHKALVTMENNGARPRTGPSNMKENARGQALSGDLRAGAHYVLVCGPEIRSDIMRMAASTGLWSSVAQYQNAKAIYNAEVGTYLGFRVVLTNFIPRFKRLGNTTTAVASGAQDGGGITGFTVTSQDHANGTLSASTTYYWKVTRKSLTRGFEEDISIEHTTATSAGHDSLRFDFPSTTDYVFNLYFGSSSGDSNLKLVQENIAGGSTVDVNSVPTSGATPPGSNNTTGPVDTVYPAFVVADQWLAWVGLQQLRTYVTGEAPDKSDPLGQISTIGYKFMAKAVILDQLRGLRLELASNF